MVSSCGTGEPETRTEFIIENVSSYKVELTVFDAGMPNQYSKDVTFLLNSNSEVSHYYITDGESQPYTSPFSGSADSAYIVFDDTLQIIYRQDNSNPRNVLDISSWDEVIESVTYFKYTYSITDEDYENAVSIE
jgi:hypothetical protein